MKMVTDALNQVWPEWHIEEKPLGKGSYSVVYKAVRRDYDVKSYAAIKVISIPVDSSVVDSLRSEGLDMNATKTSLQNIVNDFVSEIQLMESLKGVQNIVSIEDYRVVEKVGEIGWDIYIRMELLTSLDSYICDKKLTENEVIKLGCDICTALEICARRNIIHRDIKPGNIFINDFGYFKLGDFGIARKIENMTGGFSQKGTPNYMAPEVVKSSEYDARVDIYSLGIVLYRLLNGNRLPFLNLEKQLLDYKERKNALDRRLNGEKLPAPCEASPAMANLILRACAYDPNLRFSSATEMKQALTDVANGTYQIAATNNSDRRATDCKVPTDSNQKFGQTVHTFGTAPKKKNNLPAIVATVLSIVVLIGAGFFAIPRLINGNPNKTLSETNSETADYSDFDKEQITSIITEAEALALVENYKNALIKIKTGLVTYPKSQDLQDKADEYVKALTVQVKTNAITTADNLARNNDYLGAFQTIKTAMESTGEDAELANKAKAYENEYIVGVVRQIDTYIEEGNFDAADKLVLDTLNHFPSNTSIKEQQERIENSQSVYLSNEPGIESTLWDVCPPYQSGGNYDHGFFENVPIAGQIYREGYVVGSNGFAWFNLNGDYDTLSFDIGHRDNAGIYDAEFKIYLDDVLAYTLNLKSDMLPKHVTIPLSGALQMKFVTDFHGDHYALINTEIKQSENNQGVYTSDPPVEKPTLWDVCPPYQSGGNYDHGFFENVPIAGQTYRKGYVVGSNGFAWFNLNGEYDTLSFDIGHRDDAGIYDAEFKIYLDDVLAYTLDLKSDMLPKHVIISLSGALQMKFVTDFHGDHYALVNTEIR